MADHPGGHDHRPLRPNIVIGGVERLTEREWPGGCLRIGKVLIGVQHLRQRFRRYDRMARGQGFCLFRRYLDEGAETLTSPILKITPPGNKACWVATVVVLQ